MVLKHRILPKKFVWLIGFFIMFSLFAILNNLYTYHNWQGGEYTTSALDFLTGSSKSTWSKYAGTSYVSNAIIEYFFGKYHGVFIFSPILMLSVLGVGLLWKKNKQLFMTIILSSSFFMSGYLLISPVSFLFGGDPPFRYFMPVLPLMSLPFSLGIQRFSRKWMYRILFFILSLISFAFSIEFAINRWLSLAHLKMKSDLINTIYRGLDSYFPSLGPTKVSEVDIPQHHPLDQSNEIFILVMVLSLFIGIFISFFSKSKLSKSLNT